jgi:hypothetical protein
MASCLALLGAALTTIASAGTYNEKTAVFKLVDSQSERHVVRIFTGKTVITFRERPAGEPEAIEIAKSTGTAVLFTPAELSVEVVEPIKPADRVVVAQLRVAPVQAIQPTGEEVAV